MLKLCTSCLRFESQAFVQLGAGELYAWRGCMSVRPQGRTDLSLVDNNNAHQVIQMVFKNSIADHSRDLIRFDNLTLLIFVAKFLWPHSLLWMHRVQKVETLFKVCSCGNVWVIPTLLLQILFHIKVRELHIQQMLARHCILPFFCVFMSSLEVITGATEKHAHLDMIE